MYIALVENKKTESDLPDISQLFQLFISFINFKIIEVIGQFHIDLSLNTGRDDLQMNVVLLVKTKITVAHDVKGVDHSTWFHWGVEGQLC